MNGKESLHQLKGSWNQKTDHCTRLVFLPCVPIRMPISTELQINALLLGPDGTGSLTGKNRNRGLRRFGPSKRSPVQSNRGKPDELLVFRETSENRWLETTPADAGIIAHVRCATVRIEWGRWEEIWAKIGWGRVQTHDLWFKRGVPYRYMNLFCDRNKILVLLNRIEPAVQPIRPIKPWTKSLAGPMSGLVLITTPFVPIYRSFWFFYNTQLFLCI